MGSKSYLSSMKFKQKALLDTMTQDQILKYRWKLLGSPGYSAGSPTFNYIQELEFYTDERFDETTSLYNKWKKDVEEGKEDELTLLGKSNLVRIGLDGMKWIKAQEKEKYGLLKYII